MRRRAATWPGRRAATWMRRCERRWPERRWPDDGNAPLELLILAPVILFLIGLVIAAGRTSIAQAAVDAAARDAARQASIAVSPASAQLAATSSARAALRADGLQCRPVIRLDVAGFATPLGEPAQVSATVTCTVRLSDLLVPGIPGARQLTASFTSPLDPYRARALGAEGGAVRRVAAAAWLSGAQTGTVPAADGSAAAADAAGRLPGSVPAAAGRVGPAGDAARRRSGPEPATAGVAAAERNVAWRAPRTARVTAAPVAVAVSGAGRTAEAAGGLAWQR